MTHIPETPEEREARWLWEDTDPRRNVIGTQAARDYARGLGLSGRLAEDVLEQIAGMSREEVLQLWSALHPSASESS